MSDNDSIRHIYWPMLAKSKNEIFDDKNWLFEAKLDGIRAIAYVDKSGNHTIFNRSGTNVTHRFPDITFDTKGSCVLDGEIVCFDPVTKIPNFQRMQSRMHREREISEYAKKYPATFVAFDLLELYSREMVDSALLIRKELLTETMRWCPGEYPHIKSYPLNYELGKGITLFANLTGWEGVMAKRINSRYLIGMRSPNWLKIKPRKTVEVYCVGCTPGKGKRALTFGAIIIAEKYASGYRYLGDIGTGYTDEQADILLKIVKDNLVYDSPLPYNIHPNVMWCTPFPIAVSYIEKTNAGLFRLPSFEGFR